MGITTDVARAIHRDMQAEIDRLEAENEDLKAMLLQIAQDNSPHDAQGAAERWAEREYGPDWWRR